MKMVSKSIQITFLKILIGLILGAWCCVWILKPTQLWKKSWHKAEDWADSTFTGESGINVLVFCFPLLAVAVLGYIYLHLYAKEGRIRKKAYFIGKFSNPIIPRSPMGIISGCELMASALFIMFLAWTYYSNVASDFKKLTPSKSIPLNRRQLKVMSLGVRFGSLSEACLALLLIPVLRGMALFNICGIQFEASIRYHIWIGNAIMFFSVLHGTIIMCVWGSKHSLWMEITRWQRTGRVYLAGAITLGILVIIWITSLPQLRRKNFQFFYLTHHFYALFLIFFLLHAGAGHFYLVFSGVLLFALDKILRVIQSRRTTCLISARILPCEAVELTLPKDPCMQYNPTSTLFVKIPSISNFQWHPFSITSSSNMEDDRLSLLIKCQGSWTNSLYHKLKSIGDSTSDDVKNFAVAVEGPYGPMNFPYHRYDSLILIAGGSGITPFLSILQDVASRNGRMNNYCKKVQLIYAVRKTQDLSMLTPISSVLLKEPADLGRVQLRLFVTKGKEGSRTSVEELLLEVSQLKTINLGEGSSSDRVPRPESSLSKATITGLASIVFLVALVCLTHVFVHQSKRNSLNKTPSWISDLLIICSFIIATSCSTTMVTILYMWKKTTKPSDKNSRSFSMNSERIQDVPKHEISYGQRPNLTEMLLEHIREAGESKVGVFVCGPDSMHESVASFCTKYYQKSGRKSKCLYEFHSINFSL
ncbi:uncharacterized protein A4U43_C09F16720 [Asparagus officinalis]|uniref:FAD-binding FR-type domain-containing protein n=1 Tax=Asparagus officinalis TaxID=4686 RepID=A0A5P1EB97_ASPOF|nr:ferric reduction oxidase 8, mitochondrial [Asparagus officinalis]ONK58795.1 uncharacterized protein A4U43_C09F16720 [Asparagus officinalis]